MKTMNVGDLRRVIAGLSDAAEISIVYDTAVMTVPAVAAANAGMKDGSDHLFIIEESSVEEFLRGLPRPKNINQ